MIKAIAFDLDDTLLDTSGLLAPQATVQAFELMIKRGLKLSTAQCEAFRQQLVKTMSHREVFEKLAAKYGTDETRTALPQITSTFYEPTVPTQLPLIEGARQNIDYLKAKYTLYLVTAGAEKSQLEKVKALGVLSDFKKVYVVNSLTNQRKYDVFSDIIKDMSIKNEELLCIGNSLLSEIHDALSIGAKACYFEFGEARGSLAELSRKPDYHITQHSQLITACQL